MGRGFDFMPDRKHGQRQRQRQPSGGGARGGFRVVSTRQPGTAGVANLGRGFDFIGGAPPPGTQRATSAVGTGSALGARPNPFATFAPGGDADRARTAGTNRLGMSRWMQRRVYGMIFLIAIFGVLLLSNGVESLMGAMNALRGADHRQPAPANAGGEASRSPFDGIALIDDPGPSDNADPDPDQAGTGPPSGRPAGSGEDGEPGDETPAPDADAAAAPGASEAIASEAGEPEAAGGLAPLPAGWGTAEIRPSERTPLTSLTKVPPRDIPGDVIDEVGNTLADIYQRRQARLHAFLLRAAADVAPAEMRALAHGRYETTPTLFELRHGERGLLNAIGRSFTVEGTVWESIELDAPARTALGLDGVNLDPRAFPPPASAPDGTGREGRETGAEAGNVPVDGAVASTDSPQPQAAVPPPSDGSLWRLLVTFTTYRQATTAAGEQRETAEFSRVWVMLPGPLPPELDPARVSDPKRLPVRIRTSGLFVHLVPDYTLRGGALREELGGGSSKGRAYPLVATHPRHVEILPPLPPTIDPRLLASIVDGAPTVSDVGIAHLLYQLQYVVDRPQLDALLAVEVRYADLLAEPPTYRQRPTVVRFRGPLAQWGGEREHPAYVWRLHPNPYGVRETWVGGIATLRDNVRRAVVCNARQVELIDPVTGAYYVYEGPGALTPSGRPQPERPFLMGEQVEIVGYYLSTWEYEIGPGRTRLAPWVVALSIRQVPAAPRQADVAQWVMVGILALAGVVLFVLIRRERGEVKSFRTVYARHQAARKASAALRREAVAAPQVEVGK